MTHIANKAHFLDRNTIQFNRCFDTSIEKTWKALSIEKEIAKWFMPTELNLKIGGRYKFNGGWSGWIGALSPFSHIQFNTSDKSFTRFEINKTKTGVDFLLIDKLPPEMPLPKDLPAVKGIANHITQNQPGGIGTHWTGIVAGWHSYVDALDTLLTGSSTHQSYVDLCYAYNSLLESYWQSVQDRT